MFQFFPSFFFYRTSVMTTRFSIFCDNTIWEDNSFSKRIECIPI